MSDAGDLASAATEADPATGLRAVRALRRLVEYLERSQVARARALGWSWQQIADVLGVSRQAVHKKHGRRRG
ncbi:MAG TPA: helix-turn-helix domain-containing protein [Nocardioidaceae bacterium]|nr:helix-turn-helix domain-containing protein [Nocardioidaceae bacterium]